MRRRGVGRPYQRLQIRQSPPPVLALQAREARRNLRRDLLGLARKLRIENLARWKMGPRPPDKVGKPRNVDQRTEFVAVPAKEAVGIGTGFGQNHLRVLAIADGSLPQVAPLA